MSDALTVDSLLGGGRWFWRVVLATGKGTGLREASYHGGVLRRVGGWLLKAIRQRLLQEAKPSAAVIHCSWPL